ncbi:hypothetical protein HZC27_01660 [Candidatus Roizmanbacteria bacterium]|nr:hypothetical protein [Candidatus Roizmanbacteria bacterium]
MLKKIITRFIRSSTLPLFFVVLVAVVIAFQNIDIHTYYSGWDNVHPEFNLSQYAKRVFFGAWLEYQGMGAPAAQGHLAEIPRLPIIAILKLIVPDNLNRYFFIFLMFLTGGIGMYFYLVQAWLKKDSAIRSKWIACLCAIFYLLNIITLQQFYISFEMFTVQFAFLPFLLLSIHALHTRISSKNALLFILVQLLIAPSAHTPTLFYLGAVFSLIYSFFLSFRRGVSGFFLALKMMMIVGVLTFIANSYWILPNLYYLFHDSKYVTQSVANQLFGMESIWSIRQAGDLKSFLTGIHYLFSWKVFNFGSLQHEYIFGVWIPHLTQYLAQLLLVSFTLFAIIGFVLTIFKPKKGSKRWGMVLMGIVSAVAIWMGVFLPPSLVDYIYRSKTVQEIFRNPFTKFSIIFTFAFTVFLSHFYEIVIEKIKRVFSRRFSLIISVVIFFSSILSIIYIALPSFQGNFISDKLKISYPSEYSEMFNYLNTRPQNLRVLELPFFTQDGWVTFNWSQNGNANGYQGVGFYFFGFPQPLITPDFGRWSETTDFFYSELKYALNNKDTHQLRSIFNKYKIDLVLVDEAAIDKYKQKYNYEAVHQALSSIGYTVAWHKNLISIYEKPFTQNESKLIVPSQITKIHADLDRVRRDYVYESVGDYVTSEEKKADVMYPFMGLTKLQSNDVVFENNKATLNKEVAPNNYQIGIPGSKDNIYTTIATVSYKNRQIQIKFPETTIITNSTSTKLPQLENIFLDIDKDYDSIIVWFNSRSYTLIRNQTIYAVISVQIDKPLELFIGDNTKDNVEIVKTSRYYSAVWKQLNNDINITSPNTSSIKIQTAFQMISADFGKNKSENCDQYNQGNIHTDTFPDNHILYRAEESGVNCNHYAFNEALIDYPYLMHISGKNILGRSIKFFANYEMENTITDEYLMPEGLYNTTLNLLPLKSNNKSVYTTNWETRSFGKTSINELDSIKIIPFQIDRISQIGIRKNGANKPMDNPVKEIKVVPFQNFFYSVNLKCQTTSCFVGINQSYDDLWIAIDNNFRLLNHLRYNNWANLWQTNNSTNIAIIYIPEVISLIGISFLCMFCAILLIRLFNKR